ncbi:hypothetical protein [Nocardia yamanashiensis]|uniref:hypothetical protein n=1 Tax=Nocardia yamanashiensis TaxID=209247 RepID=UPI000831C0E1|nr:hypothetical protein [Nocardia yamanashiensis]
MGLDYTFQVFVHRDRAIPLLRTIAENMAARNRPDRTVVEIAGQRITMPCTTNFRSGTTVRLDPDAGRNYLELALEFEPDDELRTYHRTDGGSSPCVIGVIYLLVRDASWLAPDQLEFGFTAATTGMSILFQMSGSVRNWFADLTIDNGGPLCLLDQEQGPELGYSPGYFDVVSAGTRRVHKHVNGSRRDIAMHFGLLPD